MKIQSRLALVSAMMAALFVPALMPVASAINAVGEVTIEVSTCGLSIASGSLDYGTLTLGTLSAEKNLVIENLGNTPGTLSIYGENWKAAGGALVGDVMEVGTTHYSPTTPTAYADMRVLTGLPAVPVAGDITPGAGNGKPIYFQLRPELMASATGFSGDATQLLTLTAAC